MPQQKKSLYCSATKNDNLKFEHEGSEDKDWPMNQFYLLMLFTCQNQIVDWKICAVEEDQKEEGIILVSERAFLRTILRFLSLRLLTFLQGKK